jgi:hypothetical protein
MKAKRLPPASRSVRGNPARAVDQNGSMRKRIAGAQDAETAGKPEQGWLDLEQLATVEVTSEDPSFPIESAFGIKDGPGWRASQGGEQQIRIIFDEPVSLHRIQLRFDAEAERTQEFALRWSPAAGGLAREIVRQQWNFSPAGSTTEIEDYAVDLEAVSGMELAIQPDLHRREAVATLASWRLG